MNRAKLVADIQQETGVRLDEADPLLAAAFANRVLLREMLAEIESASDRASTEIAAASRTVVKVAEVFPEHMRLLGDALIGRMAQEMHEQVSQAGTARRHTAWLACVCAGLCVVTLVTVGIAFLRLT